MAFSSTPASGVSEGLYRQERELRDWSRRLHGGPAGYLARTFAAALDFFVWFPTEVFLLWLLRRPLGLHRGDLFLSFTGSLGFSRGLWVSTGFVQFGFAMYMSVSDGLGGSVGKRLMRLKVINHDSGLDLGITRSFTRQFVARVISPFCYIGFITGLFDPERRMLHDRASGAMVVRQRQTETVRH